MDLVTPSAALAHAADPGAVAADLLPELHRELLSRLGAPASILLLRSAYSGDYRATSAAFSPPRELGPGRQPMLRLSGAQARTLDRLGAEAAIHGLAELPSLADWLGARRALIVPVAGGRRANLAVAADTLAESRALEAAGRARIEFALALELGRLAQGRALHRRLQELFLGFSRGVTGTPQLRGALDILSHDLNALFGTRRTSVWLHDRRQHELVLAASSDADYAARLTRLPTNDVTSTAVRGLRQDRPVVSIEHDPFAVVAALRGWRRALGTIVVEGEPETLDAEPLADLLHDFSRELAVGIENVQLLEDILRQRRLLEDTFNSLVDLVVVMDDTLRIVQMNEAFVARVQAKREDLIERTLDELVGVELTAWLRESKTATGVRSTQVTDRRLGGTFLVTVTPLKSQDPVGHVLVARDITAQVRLEAEREGLRERLAQSQRLASLGQFVAGIAHEMNNPLQGVLGHLELLAGNSQAARPFRRELRRIYGEADRAAKIVRNLLVFAGSQRMTRRRLSVDRILSRAITSRRTALRKAGITLARSQGADLPQVSGDALLLLQAFLNILINAEHAVVEQDGERRIEVATTLDEPRRFVAVTIRDTGRGIPDDVLPRIFDPFFTTKEVGKGTGLGLAITYGIIQEHGGTIRSSRHPDGGAQFTVELPVTTGV
jgi:PAS domain S-box-containing protein